jgi:spoIIIJ-associated protein
MSAERTNLEIIAPTVEEAVQKGLMQLNMKEEAVHVEVLDAGSRGLFGIGSRQARVRLTVRTEGQDREEVFQKIGAEADIEAEAEIDAEVNEQEESPIAADDAVQTARQTVSDLLEKMLVRAKVTATMQKAVDSHDEDTVIVNIEGDDLSILIGRRSETLNALQYITSLIVGKQLNHWVPVMIDVQGYRARRERQLRVLARRMADQAMHTGKRQVLEPMPASERRVIHMELRDHPQVMTESTGDEPNRKITILLKK